MYTVFYHLNPLKNFKCVFFELLHDFDRLIKLRAFCLYEQVILTTRSTVRRPNSYYFLMLTIIIALAKYFTIDQLKLLNFALSALLLTLAVVLDQTI